MANFYGEYPIIGSSGGGGTITLTGDVTGSGTSSIATSLVATTNGTLTTLNALTSALNLNTIGVITSGQWHATKINAQYGGTGITGSTILAGDMTYAGTNSPTNLTALNIGSTGQVLTVSGGLPVWATPAASGITGPGTTVVNNITAWNSTTGAAVLDTGIQLTTGSGTGGHVSFFVGPGTAPSIGSVTDTVVIGNPSTAPGNHCVSIGSSTGTGGGDYCVSIGGQITATSTRSTCIGYGAYAADSSVSVGSEANNGIGTGQYSVNVGYLAGYNNGHNYVTNIGAQANGAGGANCIHIGYLAGDYDSAAAALYIDAFDRTNTAGGKTGSIIYGVMNATVSSQTLTFNAAVTVNNSIGINSTQTTLTGSAGTAVCSQPSQGATHKKVIIYLSGYTDTGTQTYTFPTAFTHTPYIYGLAAGVAGATVTSTTIKFTVTTQTGFVFLEGY